jgi:hypothetical protein
MEAMAAMENSENRRGIQVSLKVLAQHLGLTPGTVSKVLNNSNGAQAISQRTKDRVYAAARELQYRPNFHAQSLRTKRTYMVGVLVPEIGDPDNGLLIGGIEAKLRQRGFLLLTGAHRNNAALLEGYMSLFQSRGVEGVILVDAGSTYELSIPVVAVAAPDNWRMETPAAAMTHWGSSEWNSIQSRRFLARIGEAAMETLLARIEERGETLPALTKNPGSATNSIPDYPQAASAGRR